MTARDRGSATTRAALGARAIVRQRCEERWSNGLCCKGCRHYRRPIFPVESRDVGERCSQGAAIGWFVASKSAAETRRRLEAAGEAS